MIEWATRPYYPPAGAVYEGRLMEATLINALHRAGPQFGEQLYHWPGNLPVLPPIGHDFDPGFLAPGQAPLPGALRGPVRRRLATAGTHSNLRLPDPLLAWDFMHLPPASAATATWTTTRASSTSPPPA